MLRAPFVLLINLFRLLKFLWARFWHGLGHFLTRKHRKFVVLKIPRDFVFGPPQGWAAHFQDEPTFLEFRRDIKRLARDPNIEGVVITAQIPTMGLARLGDVTDMVGALKADGKHIVAHAQMATLREYSLLSVADELAMTPAGRLYMFGPRMDQFFAAETLERVGVTAQVVHIGPFKTAYHRFIHTSMPSAQELMMRQLFGRLKGVVEERIGSTRSLSEPLDDLLGKMPIDSREAMRMGLIDGECFRQDIARYIANKDEATTAPVEEKTPVRTYVMDRYMKSSPPPFEWAPLFRAPKRFAVMDLSGMIIMPDMKLPGQAGAAINPDEVVPKLRAIAADRRIAGLLLHINSPGGSALASDIIWHAIQEVRQKKPVVAFMSDVAASGGYYLAVAADQIVCRPETITGSIGVIAGKMSAGGALEKLGIKIESIYEEDSALFTSLVHPLPASVMDNLQADARSFYRLFLQRVGQARQLSRRRLHRYARGRVYLGEDALRRGLVDQLGTFDEAVELLATLCEADPLRTKLQFVAHRKQSLKAVLRQNVSAELMGWTGAVEPALVAAAMLRREPVLALMPYKPALFGEQGGELAGAL
ncbi:MAG: signal peptide peptidase SppA [Bradymonadaceae bacterium]